MYKQSFSDSLYNKSHDKCVWLILILSEMISSQEWNGFADIVMVLNVKLSVYPAFCEESHEQCKHIFGKRQE